MNCTNCGAPLAPGAQFCPNCGAQQPAAPQQYQQPAQQPYQQGYQAAQAYSDENLEDAPLWLKIVCFLIPIVGVVLYFMNKSKAPVKAKSCILYAAIGFGVNILFTIF